MAKPKIIIVQETEAEDVEFQEVKTTFSLPQFAPLGQGVERVSHIILLALWFPVKWLVVKPLLFMLIWIWKGIENTVEDIRSAIVKFVVRVALWAALFGFLLLLVANGFSLSETFSADGLEILWRAFQ